MRWSVVRYARHTVRTIRKQCQQFSEEMGALRKIFDLSQFGKGKVFINHTPERKRELVERLEEILIKRVVDTERG